MPKRIQVTLDEIMCARAAKEINDGDVVFVGQGYPLLSSYLAKKTHAPKSIIMTENGIIDFEAYRPLQHIGDLGSCKGASMCTDLAEIFSANLFKGYVDVGFLSAAEIDRYGNMNTSYVKGVHFVGAGGAPDIGSYAKRTIILIRHGKFVEKCEYLTTPGYLEGYESRFNANLPADTGPATVISSKGVFRFSRDTKEMYLESYHPGVTIEQIREEIPWNLKISPSVFRTHLPTATELEIMRNWAPTICLGRSFFIQVMMEYMQNFMQEAQNRRKSLQKV